ncbi:hypothetical protein UlMin_012665 [Ulmus minor]
MFRIFCYLSNKLYPLNGLYPGAESIVPSRSVPPIISATHLQDLQGYADTGTSWPLYSSALPVELVLRVLCPFDKIGHVIGKGGNTIKGIRQASGARIEVDDTRGDRDECIITITATESMAIEAVLLLQGKINGEDEDMFTIRLLIPSKGIECIIGKSGSIISDIRKRTRADVHISKGEKPKSTLIVVDGAPNPFVGTESLYSDGSGLSMSSVADSGSGLGMISSSDLYGYGYLPVCSYMDILPIPSTLDMMIPANAVDKVMGKEAANLSNIRKISGAMVKISESKSSWGDRIAHISRTSEQKHTAESLIKAFMMAS